MTHSLSHLSGCCRRPLSHDRLWSSIRRYSRAAGSRQQSAPHGALQRRAAGAISSSLALRGLAFLEQQDSPPRSYAASRARLLLTPHSPPPLKSSRIKPPREAKAPPLHDKARGDDPIRTAIYVRMRTTAFPPLRNEYTFFAPPFRATLHILLPGKADADVALCPNRILPLRSACWPTTGQRRYRFPVTAART